MFMQNLFFNLFLFFLVVYFVANKLTMYIRYKRSGKIILKVESKTDVLYIIVWGIIAFLWWIPILIDVFNGRSIDTSKITIGICWVIFILLLACVQSVKPIVTEGGLYARGQFWKWNAVRACYWDKHDRDRLMIEVPVRRALFKSISPLSWKIEKKDKLKVENAIMERIL